MAKLKDYKDLNSKERANYWAMMHLFELYNLFAPKEISEDIHDSFLESLSILAINTGIKLFSDPEENK